VHTVKILFFAFVFVTTFLLFALSLVRGQLYAGRWAVQRREKPMLYVCLVAVSVVAPLLFFYVLVGLIRGTLS
jgi:hypothetical protein